MFFSTKTSKMDYKEPKERKKKSDKAKEKFERNGAYSQKHVRQKEALAEKKATRPKPK